jgi:hypothetical protein
MPVELELTSLILALQAEELNSSNISQRINALLALEEQRKHALENLKKRQQTVKKYLIRKLNLLFSKLMTRYCFGMWLMLIKESIPSFKSCG